MFYLMSLFFHLTTLALNFWLCSKKDQFLIDQNLAHNLVLSDNNELAIQTEWPLVRAASKMIMLEEPVLELVYDASKVELVDKAALELMEQCATSPQATSPQKVVESEISSKYVREVLNIEYRVYPQIP